MSAKRVLPPSVGSPIQIRKFRYGDNELAYIAFKKDDLDRNMSEETEKNLSENRVECEEWKG